MIYFVGNNSLISDDRIKEAKLQDVIQFLESDSQRIMGVDTETEGMFDFDNKVIMLQIGNEKDQYVIDTRVVDISPLKFYFESDNFTKIFWNAKFDINFIRFSFGFRTQGVHDCFLVECLLNAGKENAELNLNAASIKYNGKQLNKSVRNKFVGLGGVPFTTNQIVYGAEDVEGLITIKNKQDKEIKKYSMENAVYLENKAVIAIAEVEYNGIKLDINKWIEVAAKTEQLTNDYVRILDDIVLNDTRLSRFIPPGIQTNLFDFEERRIKINWGSPKQKLEVLKTLLPELENSDIRELLRYRHEPLVAKLIELSKYKKLAESFGRDFLKFINGNTGRVHQSIWQILATGRMSSSDPNMTQIPSKGELAELIRAAFIPEEGNVFVGGDFSGCELRIIADQSGDPVWIEAFKNNEDLHSKLACLTFDITLDKVSTPTPFKPSITYRDVQKTINFGLAYGMSEFKLSKTIDVDVETARKIIDKFFSQVPLVKRYLKRSATFGIRNLYVQTPRPYNRTRFFEDPKGDFKLIGSIERASMNMPVQGANADIIKSALVLISTYIKVHGLNVKIVNVIHDELITECPREMAEEWREIMNNLMVQAAEIVVKNVPMKVDCKISDYWKK